MKTFFTSLLVLVVCLLINAGCDNLGVDADSMDPPAEIASSTSVTPRYDTVEEYAQEILSRMSTHMNFEPNISHDTRREVLGELSDEMLAEMAALRNTAEELEAKNPCFPGESAGQGCVDFVGIVEGGDIEPSQEVLTLIDDSRKTLDDAIALARRVGGMEAVLAFLESLDDEVSESIVILVQEMLYFFPHLRHMTQTEWRDLFVEQVVVNSSIPCKWHCSIDFGLELADIAGTAVALMAGCVVIALLDGPIPIMDVLALACVSGVYASASSKGLQASMDHDKCRKDCEE